MNETLPEVLIASSNAGLRAQLVKALEPSCPPILEASGGADALAKLHQHPCQALLLDRHLHDLDVEDVLRAIRQQYPQVGVFVLDSQTGEAVIAQPPVPESSALPFLELLRKCWHPEPPGGGEAPCRPPRVLEAVEPLPGMIGSSPGVARVYLLARLVSSRDTAVLLMGETGTGKELVARAIHGLGPRSKRPFVVVNCAAIPETLLEAELFGYSRGAFTGAFQNHLGRIHSAHGGTVLLDEVAELPGAMQAKLLRFLQEGEVQRLGSPDVFRVDVRVIAATNARLARRVADGLFRRDLYYRLAVFPIELPALREHPEDIAPLAERTLASLCQKAHVPQKALAGSALRVLEQHSWPGNVRELEHAVERAFILAADGPVLLPEHFSLRDEIEDEEDAVMAV